MKSVLRARFDTESLFRNKSYGALTELDHQCFVVAPTPKRPFDLRLSGQIVSVSPTPERCFSSKLLTRSYPDSAFLEATSDVAVELFSILAKGDSNSSTPLSRLSPVSDFSGDSLTRAVNPMVRNDSFDSLEVIPSTALKLRESNPNVPKKAHAKKMRDIRKSRSMSWPAPRPADSLVFPLLGGASVAAGI